MTRHTEDLLDEIADLERRCAGCEAQAELLYRIYDETDGTVDLTDAAWAFEEIADRVTRAIRRREDELEDDGYDRGDRQFAARLFSVPAP